jgi:cytochrome d ubiquinol oxidase subunit II
MSFEIASFPLFQALDLNRVWFVLVGVLLTGYAILDGFDLGVGALHLFTRTDEERRLMLNAIGPVWDGNEVWLVTGGGALFAAFPDVYATAFSGFYLAFMLLLVMLIFRAVAIEFRSKQPMRWWRQGWDVSFSISSVVGALLLGIALGNVAQGIPLGPGHEFAGTFLGLLNPYALLVGVTTVAMFAMHASIYIVLKTKDELQRKARGWILYTLPAFVIGYVTTTMVTLLYIPSMTQHVRQQPAFFIVALLNMLAIANIPREIYHNRPFNAFLSSCLTIALMMGLFGLGIFPDLLPSNPHAEYGLHIYNAASSQKTLGIMLIITLLAAPLVLAYTASIYWVFRGKVELTPKSY